MARRAGLLGVLQRQQPECPYLHVPRHADRHSELGDGGLLDYCSRLADGDAVEVELDISYTWDSDLTAYVIAPDGTRVQLFANVGGGGQNFTGTILDDNATAPIGSGQAPFSGRYKPTGNLSDAYGLNAQGTWTLEVDDGAVWDSGSIDEWSLLAAQTLRVCRPVCARQPICDGHGGPSPQLVGSWHIQPSVRQIAVHLHDRLGRRLDAGHGRAQQSPTQALPAIRRWVTSATSTLTPLRATIMAPRRSPTPRATPTRKHSRSRSTSPAGRCRFGRPIAGRRFRL